jgi:hypothetical protein
MESSNFLVILLTLASGTVGGVVLSNWLQQKKTNLKSGLVTRETRLEATLLLERIEKVFKVVMAEGYFSEILSYQDVKKILGVLNDEKKALIIAKAKVLVGYDFSNMRFRQVDANSDSKKLIIEYFPEPEILSIDTDYKFYDIDPGYLNYFKSEDYTRLLDEAKKTMYERALQSDLPRIANNQIQYMIYQLADSMGWRIELPPTEQKKLDNLTEHYDELNAHPKALPDNTLKPE